MSKSIATQNPVFAPIFTKEKVGFLEEQYETTWGRNRRVMMEILSLSSDQLLDVLAKAKESEGDAEVTLAMTKAIINFRTHLYAGIELADSALARITTVGDFIVETSNDKHATTGLAKES